VGQPIFSASFTPTASAPTGDPFVFTITADVVDTEAVWSGLNVLLDDLLLLDTGNSVSGSVSRYRVVGIGTLDYVTVTIDVRYDDVDSSPIDPSGAIGFMGVIGRPSPNARLPWISSNDTQGFPIKIVNFTNNINSWAVLDPAVFILNKEVPLLASQTNTPLSELTFDSRTNKSAMIEYTIVDSSFNRRKGIITIVCNSDTGVAASSSEIIDRFAETADVNTSWNTFISGNNAQVRYTTTVDAKVMNIKKITFNN
jgi:hypothetical protein